MAIYCAIKTERPSAASSGLDATAWRMMQAPTRPLSRKGRKLLLLNIGRQYSSFCDAQRRLSGKVDQTAVSASRSARGTPSLLQGEPNSGPAYIAVVNKP